MNGTLNKVMLIGHLGDDVKMHYFEGGGSIGRFPLATNESYVNKSSGERVTSAEWHNIVVRNKAAEVCEKYLSKGDRIYVDAESKRGVLPTQNSEPIICTLMPPIACQQHGFHFFAEVEATDRIFVPLKRSLHSGVTVIRSLVPNPSLA